MKNKDETRSKVFGFVDFVKHTEDDIANRMEKTVKKFAVV